MIFEPLENSVGYYRVAKSNCGHVTAAAGEKFLAPPFENFSPSPLTKKACRDLILYYLCMLS